MLSLCFNQNSKYTMLYSVVSDVSIQFRENYRSTLKSYRQTYNFICWFSLKKNHTKLRRKLKFHWNSDFHKTCHVLVTCLYRLSFPYSSLYVSADKASVQKFNMLCKATREKNKYWLELQLELNFFKGSANKIVQFCQR